MFIIRFQFSDPSFRDNIAGSSIYIFIVTDTEISGMSKVGRFTRQPPDKVP